MTINQILLQIANTSSTNTKVDLIKQHNNNELLKRVFNAAYNKANYFMKKVPIVEEFNGTSTLEEAMNSLLPELSSRKITGNEAIRKTYNVLSSLNEDDSDVLSQILRKDLNIGIGKKLINKAYGEVVIPEDPYMRCNTFSVKRFERFEFPFYSEEKMDGLFCNVIVYEDGEVEFISRNGKPIKSLLKRQPKDLVEQARQARLNSELSGSVVFMGELLIKNNDGTWKSREESNGLLNSKELPTAELPNVCLVAWDLIPLSDFNNGILKVQRSDRLSLLEETLRIAIFHNINVVDYRVCYTLEQAISHFEEVLKNGGEGVIIKDRTGIWKSGTPTYEQLKLKIEADVDLEVVEVLDGHAHGKWEGKAARFLCRSSDGKVEVNVGSGFSDEFRKSLNESRKSFVGKICTVRCFGLQLADGSDIYSLYLPRLIEMRPDKDVADSFEKIEAEIELAKKFGGNK